MLIKTSKNRKPEPKESKQSREERAHDKFSSLKARDKVTTDGLVETPFFNATTKTYPEGYVRHYEWGKVDKIAKGEE